MIERSTFFFFRVCCVTTGIRSSDRFGVAQLDDWEFTPQSLLGFPFLFFYLLLGNLFFYASVTRRFFVYALRRRHAGRFLCNPVEEDKYCSERRTCANVIHPNISRMDALLHFCGRLLNCLRYSDSFLRPGLNTQGYEKYPP